MEPHGFCEADFLFATPSWQEGTGRLVDFADSLTEYNTTPASGDDEGADTRATRQDWTAVGNRIRQAIQVFQP